MMQVLQIIYSLSSGGAERFLTDLANELVKKPECHVTILIIKSAGIPKNLFYKEELSDKVKFESLDITRVRPSILYKLYKYIRNLNPDIVHIHLSPIILFCIFPILAFRRKVFIETIHNEVSKIDGSNKIYFLLKWCVYRLKNVHVCTISDKNASAFLKVYGKKSDILIYNGRKKYDKSPDFEKVKQEIEKYKQNDDTIVVTHIARCTPQKNQILLVDAFNKLHQYGVNIILLIIGDGFDSALGKELENKAQKGIFFLGQRHDVQDYLLNSDAFCLSSLYEGMPITLIEALSCGCIPLSTPVSGVTDLIKNGENGFVSKDFSMDSYVGMLNDFIENKDSISKEGLIELYNRKLSIEACANAYYNFYKSCQNIEI